MHKLLASLITIAITAALTVPATAGTRDPRVNERQHKQHGGWRRASSRES